MKSNKLRILIVLIIGVLIVGCASRGVMREANMATDKAQSKIRNMKAIDATTAPAVLTKRNYYYDTKPVASDDRASWLHSNISVSAKKVPLSFVMTRILRSSDVLVKYQPGVRKDRLVSIDYSGTVKGALELLASQTNYAYETTEQDITWEAYVTKTFDISFMPGAATYVVGQTTATTYGNNSSSGGGSSGSNTSSTTGNLMSNDQEYSGLQAASLSVWNDLKQTLDELKSSEGKVAVSEATTMVTVYDHPGNVSAMARYINELNKAMSQEVRLKVQVLEVDLDKEHTFGLDWNLMQHWLGTNVGIAGGIGTSVNVANSIGSAGASSAFSPVSLSVGQTGNNVILQALSTQGKVSVVTEPTVVTMNNQVAEIRISRDTSYLQNVSVTTGTGANDNTTTSLTPGIVTDGFILYLLPKIKDDRVFLQISSTLSNLTSLNTVDSSGTVNPAVKDAKQALNAIQIPSLAEKRFNIRGLVGNNSTLIVGGFKQTHNTTRETKFLEVKALGGQGAQVQNSETVILITPTIVEN